jgi:hypothetical protein
VTGPRRRDVLTLTPLRSGEGTMARRGRPIICRAFLHGLFPARCNNFIRLTSLNTLGVLGL